MYVNFEFAALLPSPYSRVKKCAKFKTNIHLVSVDSFLYYLSSRAESNWPLRPRVPNSSAHVVRRGHLDADAVLAHGSLQRPIGLCSR